MKAFLKKCCEMSIGVFMLVFMFAGMVQAAGFWLALGILLAIVGAVAVCVLISEFA